MNDDRLARALAAIDAANSEDPNREFWEGQDHSKELLYGRRMTEWLFRLDPEPSAARQLAARAQHIRRWQVPRQSYPADREGYLRWRKYLYRFHGEQAEAILREAGYDEATIARVKGMIGKQGIKRDADVQIIEDTACLVFLRYYLNDFVAGRDQDQLVDIVRKTWKKMSEPGQKLALTLEFAPPIASVLALALAPGEQPEGAA
ncbi:MAG: DUF4202 domain-containing protein [Methylococcaceae bacterium]|nr:DUF4202 domain-containing protein [Methylococcaceae bacterium]